MNEFPTGNEGGREIPRMMVIIFLDFHDHRNLGKAGSVCNQPEGRPEWLDNGKIRQIERASLDDRIVTRLIKPKLPAEMDVGGLFLESPELI